MSQIRTSRSDAKGLRIGELSARSGVNAQTIRFYERASVLPTPERAESGYRMYSSSDLERLTFVRKARALGFSLEAVRELLLLASAPERGCIDVCRMAREHLMQVEEKLHRLNVLRDELINVIGECHGEGPIADCRIARALARPS